MDPYTRAYVPGLGAPKPSTAALAAAAQAEKALRASGGRPTGGKAGKLGATRRKPPATPARTPPASPGTHALVQCKVRRRGGPRPRPPARSGHTRAPVPDGAEGRRRRRHAEPAEQRGGRGGRARGRRDAQGAVRER